MGRPLMSPGLPECCSTELGLRAPRTHRRHRVFGLQVQVTRASRLTDSDGASAGRSEADLGVASSTAEILTCDFRYRWQTPSRRLIAEVPLVASGRKGCWRLVAATPDHPVHCLMRKCDGRTRPLPRRPHDAQLPRRGRRHPHARRIHAWSQAICALRPPHRAT